MKKSFTNIPIVILAFLFLFASYFSFRLTMDATKLSDKIIIWIVVYFCFYMFLITLASHFKYRLVQNILNILGTPILILIFAQYYLAPIITIIMFIGFYIVPTATILNLSNSYLFLKPYLGGIIYLVNVFTVLIFAYFGNRIMGFLINNFKTKFVFVKNILDKYSTALYTRIYSYVLMIILYVIYNFISFSKENLLSFLSIESVSVIKEVFLTFVAVDSLIQILLNKKSKSKQY